MATAIGSEPLDLACEDGDRVVLAAGRVDVGTVRGNGYGFHGIQSVDRPLAVLDQLDERQLTAGRIPLEAIAKTAQMEVLSGQRNWTAIIERFGAEKLGERYTPSGLDIWVRIDQADHRALQTALADASAGRIEVVEK